MKRLLRSLMPFAVLAIVWELAGRLKLVAGGALPPPSAVIADWAANADIYLVHVGATLAAASLGFVFGVLVAVVAAIAFVLWPVTDG